MFNQIQTISTLHDSLVSLKPVELLGIQLLRQHEPASLRPAGIARDPLVAAVTELVEYGGRCAEALNRLARLHAVPLMGVMTLEYGL